MPNKHSLSPLLIANRGEIAVRIIRGAKRLGLKTVAVYSEADADAPHMEMADEAIHIGPAPAKESYLKQAAILAAAKASGAKAIHPGYGFLAENADFAEAVIAAGLIWVGPPPSAMRAMGDKAGARTLMETAGVPLLPGYQGPDDWASLKKAAKTIGYPLLVKAAAGGGGVGMRVVTQASDLEAAVKSARSTAESAFGDGRLILEKYLPIAHHVEIQILADQHGNLIHLYERECSVQRRHQKIIEESPSLLLDEKLRQAMTKAALSAARSVDYVNAGTVEFLVDPQTKEFYFLEMNTRLQVEHPVTEMVTGLDMVEWQLRIAAGEALPFKQVDIKPQGHAIECRIYAEDPYHSFLPQSGNLLALLLPDGEEARVDLGVKEGQDVGLHYDPMLAKIIVHGKDRDEAIGKMRKALAQSAFMGLITNSNYLQDIIDMPEFLNGQMDTAYIEREMAQTEEEIPIAALLAAAFSAIKPLKADSDQEDPDPYSPWKNGGAFRLGAGQ